MAACTGIAKATQAANIAVTQATEATQELKDAQLAIRLASQRLTDAQDATKALIASAEKAAAALGEAAQPLNALSTQVATLTKDLEAVRGSVGTSRTLLVLLLLLWMGTVAAGFLLLKR